MKSSMWVRCRSWLDSAMRGEIHLTADVLWLAEIDGEAPPREPPEGNWRLRHRCGSDESQYRSTRLPEIATARRSVVMRRNLSSVISPRVGRVPLMHITSAPWSTFECIADTCACSWPTRHQREHQSAAAPIPAQERRPVHAHPGRAQLCRRGSQPPPASSARVGNPGRRVRYCRAHADAASAFVAVRFSATIMTVATGDQVPEHVRCEIRVECDVAHGI